MAGWFGSRPKRHPRHRQLWTEVKEMITNRMDEVITCLKGRVRVGAYLFPVICRGWCMVAISLRLPCVHNLGMRQ